MFFIIVFKVIKKENNAYESILSHEEIMHSSNFKKNQKKKKYKKK